MNLHASPGCRRKLSLSSALLIGTNI
jgi:hypothetical protein